MLYLTAFLTGFLGSFHCLGMCGPIAMITPQGQTYAKFISGRLLYNLGRITTYATIGLVLGTFGMGLQIAGIQQYTSIVMGVLLLLIAVSKITGIGILGTTTWFSGFKQKIEKQFTKFITRPSFIAQYTVGLLNGLLPCGLVYIALAGAVTTTQATQGALYMALFGLGTLPMMFSVSIASRWVTHKARTTIMRAMPYFVMVVAVLFILRGLNLGIPYISPQLNAQNQMECCEKP